MLQWQDGVGGRHNVGSKHLIDHKANNSQRQGRDIREVVNDRRERETAADAVDKRDLTSWQGHGHSYLQASAASHLAEHQNGRRKHLKQGSAPASDNSISRHPQIEWARAAERGEASGPEGCQHSKSGQPKGGSLKVRD